MAEIGSLMRASIVIPTHGRPEFVRDTLQSVQAQILERGEFEIIVVDNAVSSETRKIVERAFAGHRMTYVPEPRAGLHFARHTGASAARSEIVVFIDDDVIIPNGWLAAMLSNYSDPSVACVGGRILPLFEVEPPAWLKQFGGNGGGYLSLLDLGDEARELAWPYVVYGCNMSVRRSVLFEVGGFNPDSVADKKQFWLRGDGETGLQRKIYNQGYKIVYDPRSQLSHRVPKSRLRKEYIYWRAFLHGISDSFAEVRTVRATRGRLLRNAAWSAFQMSRLWPRVALRKREREWQVATQWYWYGRMQHQLRLFIHADLLAHALLPTYL